MKRLAALAALLACAAAAPAAEDYPRYTLETDNHRVEITVRCPEGYVTCDRVHYRGVNKQTRKTVRLRGETMHTLCADGETPCRFEGYRFRQGKLVYRVWDDSGDTALLEVRDGQKVVLSERGAWQ